jgi:DNA-binding CsgD family transcriptional regulator
MTFEVEFVDQGRFTPREADVALGIAQGHSDKVIARLLGMSIRTVQVHTQNIYEKLELHSASIAENTAAINNRCYAVMVMVARGMISVSLKSVIAVLIFSSTLPDFDDKQDSALRIRHARSRGRVHVVQAKRGADA